jgi:hypothetical protein
VKLTEILTAVVAVYAAILSTTTLVATIRAKRWRVAVVYSFGRTIDVGGGEPFLLWYRAINLGEREVALKKFYVEVLSEKNNFFRHALNITTGRLARTSRFFTPAGILKCEPTLPFLLQPGRECEVTVDQPRLFDMFHFSWIARVRGVFEDERVIATRAALQRWTGKAGSSRSIIYPIATLAESLSSSRRRPRLMPCSLARPSPASTRSLIIARSNSAKTPIIWNIARPDDVEVSRPCWCRKRSTIDFAASFDSLDFMERVMRLIGLDPSQLLQGAEDRPPLKGERERTGGDFAAAPSAAGVGVELTALCRALGGRWRGLGALTHRGGSAARAGPLRACGAEGFRINRRRSWRMRGPRRAAGRSREANFNTIPATVCRPGK